MPLKWKAEQSSGLIYERLQFIHIIYNKLLFDAQLFVYEKNRDAFVRTCPDGII